MPSKDVALLPFGLLCAPHLHEPYTSKKAGQDADAQDHAVETGGDRDQEDDAVADLDAAEALRQGEERVQVARRPRGRRPRLRQDRVVRGAAAHQLLLELVLPLQRVRVPFMLD